MSKANDILNGWWNFIDKNEVSEKLAKLRANKCSKCKYAIFSKTIEAFIKDDLVEVQGYYCNKCKCPLSAKIRSINETCPLKKW